MSVGVATSCPMDREGVFTAEFHLTAKSAHFTRSEPLAGLTQNNVHFGVLSVFKGTVLIIQLLLLYIFLTFPKLLQNLTCYKEPVFT